MVRETQVKMWKQKSLPQTLPRDYFETAFGWFLSVKCFVGVLHYFVGVECREMDRCFDYYFDWLELLKKLKEKASFLAIIRLMHHCDIWNNFADADNIGHVDVRNYVRTPIHFFLRR